MLSLTTVEEKHRNQLEDELPWVWLYSIRVPDGSGGYDRYRMTNYTESVDFGTAVGGGALTYQPFPIVHDDIQVNSRGDLTEISLSVGNVSLETIANLEANDALIGEPVVIRVVNIESLTTNVPTLVVKQEIRGAKASASVVEFKLSSFGFTQTTFPSRRFTRTNCGVRRFGNAECGYVIPGSPGNTVGTGFDFCPRTYAACSERGADEEARAVTVLHPERFRAFRGLSRSSLR